MIPNFFHKKPIPEKLPAEMEKIVQELKQVSGQNECLEKVFQVITARYRGFRFRTYTRIHEAFHSDLERLWSKKGFMHCHVMNYLLRVFLVKSGWFVDEDIELKYSLVWYISPHQYLQIRMKDGRRVKVDPWNAYYGKKLGDWAHGFH
ncbi:hypothetical protein GYA13_04080 [Candidatus Kuenenbacteria bacterium]|nr:hypothetical protein [Candidatus Kuenenbacteria bacterium]